MAHIPLQEKQIFQELTSIIILAVLAKLLALGLLIVCTAMVCSFSCAQGCMQGSRESQIGADTTDASDSEVSHLASKKQEILEAAKAVFADADAEFATLGAVKRKLEAWKAQQPGTYRDAYMSLSVPALLAPFVRLELLQWDPLVPGNGERLSTSPVLLAFSRLSGELAACSHEDMCN